MNIKKLQNDTKTASNSRLLEVFVDIISAKFMFDADTKEISDEVEKEILRRMGGNGEFYIDIQMIKEWLANDDLASPSRSMMSVYKRGNKKKLVSGETRTYKPLLIEGTDYIKRKIGGDLYSDSGYEKIENKLKAKTGRSQGVVDNGVRHKRQATVTHLRTKKLFASGGVQLKRKRGEIYTCCTMVIREGDEFLWTDDLEKATCKGCLKRLKNLH